MADYPTVTPADVMAEVNMALAGFSDEERLIADAEESLLGLWDDALMEIVEYVYEPGALAEYANDPCRFSANSPVLACARCADTDGPFAEVNGAWLCEGCA